MVLLSWYERHYTVLMKPRKWTMPQLRREVLLARSYRDLLLRLGLKPAGGNYQHIAQIVKEEHLRLPKYRGKGWNKGLRGLGKPRRTLESILKRGTTYQSFKLKKRLIAQGVKQKRCELCGWRRRSVDGRIPLELDHINGDRYDNRLKNLRILCPNCHSLQSTHRGLNITKH